ncbi:response regulator transcription factor [Mucilaginibacter sp. FT3.2]|uniref:response regulator transcription factor n=1 Tax=Mucilaginibacter sp. FT3.2 TaxID=2723090 RepID=UPI00161EFB0A|nr:response regulator transcription factor [Mucilaginibacter sp. FT3.2]MBB6233631.1 DNA-binding response OmpR family regulator [Mucilaginibacter sp. FT3.2]
MSFSNSNNIKLLVVEDDAYMQAILEQYLSGTFEVEICSNGMAAFATLIKGNIPDLILTDLNTPLLNGMELIEQMKVSDFFKTIPIIILSSEESTTKKIECLNRGADDFMVKPFNPEELKARINVILRRTGKLSYQ